MTLYNAIQHILLPRSAPNKRFPAIQCNAIEIPPNTLPGIEPAGALSLFILISIVSSRLQPYVTTGNRCCTRMAGFTRAISTPAVMAMIPGIYKHHRCRNNVYPQSDVRRYPVPDESVFWSQPYPDYQPPLYEAAVLKGKEWADLDVGELNLTHLSSYIAHWSQSHF